MHKKRDAARAAWEAAVAKARTLADSLADKETVTGEEQKQLDDLIAEAKTAKAEFDRLDAICKELDQAEAETKALADEDAKSQGRKTRNNEAPGILNGGRGKTSAPLKVSNIFKAVFAAGSGQNPAVFKQYAGEEFDLSNRLKAAGYVAESLGGILFPLGAEWLVEPEDDQGRKLADFTELRKEIAERMAFKVDQGEIGWMLKRHPEFASSLGFDRKDMALSDDTLGGYLVPSTQSGRVIDLLRAKAALVRAGAQEFPLPPSGNLALPRLTSDPTFAYTDPDSTSDMSPSNAGTGVVRLMAKSLRGAVTIPNDLIRFSLPAVEMLMRGALAAKAALGEDNAFLENPGSSIAPKGLLYYTQSAAETPTQGRITLHAASTTGANGDTFEPEDVALIEALYEESHDPDPATAWIMRPIFFARIRNKRADAVTAGDKKGPFVFDITRSLKDGPPDMLGQAKVFRTTQLTANRTKGGGTGLHWLVYGNFNRMMIGRVGVIELAVSEHVKFLQDKTIIRAILRSDMGLEHEESFILTDTLVNA